MKRKQQQPTKRNTREAPDDFCDWWNPIKTHEPSGAAVGGHPDAKRVWARKDAGRWNRRTYGITASQAWQCQRYQDEFNAWDEAGRPDPPDGPFVSIAASVEQQQDFWHDIGDKLKAMPKPVSAREEQRQRQKLLQDQKVKLLADKKGDDDDGPIPF